MSFLYHMVKEDFRGNLLYPLNELKQVHPDLYEKEVQKYIGREQLMDETIPPFNCLWNDVIFLTAIHPQQIKDSYEASGRIVSFKSYKINSSSLDSSKLITYLYSNDEGIRDYVPFDSFDETLSILPEITKDYHRETIAQGEKPFIYYRVPHILYKGNINVDGLETIEV